MMSKHLRILGILILLVAVLAACAAPTPGVVEKVVTQEVEVVITAEPEPEDVNLVVWFLSGSPEEIELNQELIEQWAASYDKANVTIDFSPFGFEDFNNAMKLALDGHSGPDLAYGSPGGPRAQAWGEVGHLMDLTDVAEERGWTSVIPDTIMWYFNPLGPGHLWTISYDAVAIGAYYNAELFAELGLEPPATLEEFDQTLAALKDAGITPVTVGGQTPWQMTHVWSTLSHTNTPWEHYDAWMACEGGVVPEMVEAAEKFNEWIEAGYFNENALATPVQDSNTLFVTGQAAMNIGGTWNNTTFATQSEFEARFFPVPRMNPDLPEYHMGGYTPNNGWMIPVYSEQQEEALDLLEYMAAGEESALARWNTGNIVAFNFDEVPEPVFPLQADVYQAMQVAETGVYHGGPAGEIGPAMGENFQAIMGGQKTPEDAMAAIDEVYQAACAEKKEQ